ncbi:zf-HC2 domain-containing protein [Corynebacterium felinum]|uniref:Anti-sigma-YlaC factor YlaD n=1 Tax=Corynebacterium felinum TaxID=131318 RepID=A0ABU2B8Y6_9CORY|nr:zf-HC2 domain-containing protein [Corynebacterium felinum]MDF5821560.1 zf-HC2 domain-containing protein [Corynebacterium felinum]MDR7355082.1 putative anti-sigma-YlaC factor YlaD [Corynebacterium felinum]WJY94433.1 hypothetical protein CFELI_04000 [Corynebacterium felinum]
MISCDRIQAALSARLDGEPAPLEDDVIDAHLEACVQCRAFYEQAAFLNRRMNLSEARPDAIPDLSDVIIAGVEPTWRKQAASRALGVAFSRVGMVLVGVMWVLWATSLLGVSGVGEWEPVFSRLLVEAAAMRCALGFGLLFAAWQTRIVSGLLPLYGALWMFSFGFAVREIVLGELSFDSLIQLVLLAVSVVVLLWCWLSDKGWALIEFGLKSLR